LAHGSSRYVQAAQGEVVGMIIGKKNGFWRIRMKFGVISKQCDIFLLAHYFIDMTSNSVFEWGSRLEMEGRSVDG
jgi:hypothetical protein